MNRIIPILVESYLDRLAAYIETLVNRFFFGLFKGILFLIYFVTIGWLVWIFKKIFGFQGGASRRSAGDRGEFIMESRSPPRNQDPSIRTVARRGATLHISYEGGGGAHIALPAPDAELQGYTSQSVSVKHRDFVYIYNARGGLQDRIYSQ
jgi:hypothetical protein